VVCVGPEAGDPAHNAEGENDYRIHERIAVDVYRIRIRASNCVRNITRSRTLSCQGTSVSDHRDQFVQRLCLRYCGIRIATNALC
jgi:hypothetical protein